MFKNMVSWYREQTQRGQKEFALVLHTSCVNYEDTLLEQMERLPLRWFLPHSVRCELQLLAQGKIFQPQAQRILSRAEADDRRMGSWGRWDLEQLYRAAIGGPEERYQGSLIFWFGDLNKQDEFLWNVRRLPNRHQILLLNGWDCSQSCGGVRCVNELREASYRRCQVLSRGMPTGPVETLILCDDEGNRFSGRELSALGLSGTHAAVYECSRYPGKLVKIYKERAFSGNQLRKLERLCLLRKAAGAELDLLAHLALPEQLLRTPQGDVVGYTMRRCPGRPLRDYRVIGWKDHDQAKILRQLLSLLVHLHTMRVLVNDLSFNNILVDEEDRVNLVDCDSFQVFHFPGGGVTELFRHPQLVQSCAPHQLKEPRHEYFSLAVLLYQFLFCADPICPLSDDEGAELNWNNGVFPLELHGKLPGGPEVNACVLREWMRCPESLRKLFCDEFHFQEDHSFGAWIDALGLLGLNGV